MKETGGKPAAGAKPGGKVVGGGGGKPRGKAGSKVARESRSLFSARRPKSAGRARKAEAEVTSNNLLTGQSI